MNGKSVLVNIGRGQSVDTEALYDVLKERKIMGAAVSYTHLDVYKRQVKSSVMGNDTTAQLYENGSLICEKTETADGVTMQHAVRSAVYHMLKEKTGQHFPWGMLTGIRPAKTINTYMAVSYTHLRNIRLFLRRFP